MSDPVRVFLVDDHALCRRGLSDLIEQRAGMKVAGLTGDPDQAVAMISESKPDLVVMDLRMPLLGGLALLRRLRAEGIETRVIILTVSDAQEDMAPARSTSAMTR